MCEQDYKYFFVHEHECSLEYLKSSKLLEILLIELM